MKISLAATTAAVDAATAMSARRGICVQDAIDATDIPGYCACPSCSAQWADEAAAEMLAEGAWLRAAENAGEPCRGIFTMDGGCACC